MLIFSGPEPPTPTSEHPTTHTCEDGETQCEVIIISGNCIVSREGAIAKERQDQLPIFSRCHFWNVLFSEILNKRTEHALGPSLSATLYQTVPVEKMKQIAPPQTHLR